MAEKNKMPEIRFKGFSGVWEVEKFETLTKINQGLQIAISNRHTEKVNGSHFYITNEFLKEDSDIKYYIFNPPESVLCKEADVLMTRTGNTGEVVTNIAGAFHNNFFKIKFDLEDLNKNFFVYFLRLFKTQTVIIRLAGTSTIPDLNHSDFYRIEMPFPTLPEQTKIGNYFQQLDTLITQHQKKHDKLLNVKKAMLKKMFPKKGADVPEIRFKGFSEKWEEEKIGDITDCYSGGTPSVGNNLFYEGNIPFIRSGEINSHSTELFITEKGLENSSAKLVGRGDILYALYGATSGEVGVSNINGAINQAILAIKPKNECSSYFLVQWLIKQKGLILSTYLQGGQGNLSGNIVKELELNIPSSTEQTKIGNFFKNLDTLLTLHQTELEKLKNIKKACLEKMFV